MTLTDVYCRFNRARGMEVCQFSMDFFTHVKRHSVTQPPTRTLFWLVEHSSPDEPREYLLRRLSLTRISHISASTYANFRHVFISFRHVIFNNRNVLSSAGLS